MYLMICVHLFTYPLSIYPWICQCSSATVGAWRNEEIRLSSHSEVTRSRDCQTEFFKQFTLINYEWKNRVRKMYQHTKWRGCHTKKKKNHVMGPTTDTVLVAKNPRWARPGSRRKGNTIFLLKGYNNKKTTSRILLYT